MKPTVEVPRYTERPHGDSASTRDEARRITPTQRDGTLQRSSFCIYVVQLRMEVRALLREGTSCEDAKGAALCRSLLKHEPALWTFIQREGVELTNNAAEVRSVDQKPRFTNSGDWSGGERRELLVI